MKITVAARTRAPIRAAGGSEIAIQFLTTDQRAAIPAPITEGEFSGEVGTRLQLVGEGVLFVGLGDRRMLDAARFRTAAGSVAMLLRKTGRTRCIVDLEPWAQYAAPAIEGLLLGGYRYERFRTKPTAPLASVTFYVRSGDLREVRRTIEHGRIVGESANLARSIGNEPGNLLYPATLAERARRLGRDAGLKVTVLDEKTLRARKFGGLLAVGGGSTRGPRLIVLEHRGGPKTQAPVALVGKAITFDSGGISIKPAADMEEMIFDKCGGMAVLGAMSGLACLGVKRNVVGIVASAENLPSGTAYRPGDIVTTYDGKHIEIVNTDAEGRVVLADAIAYARKDCRAAAIVDLATLTGACGVALGEYAAGFWASDDALKARVLAAAERAGERLWPMPLFQDYTDQIQSDVALLKNSGGRLGGACTAAAFLKTFAEDTPGRTSTSPTHPIGRRTLSTSRMARMASACAPSSIWSSISLRKRSGQRGWEPWLALKKDEAGSQEPTKVSSWVPGFLLQIEPARWFDFRTRVGHNLRNFRKGMPTTNPLPRFPRLFIEPLEARIAPAAFVVTSFADSGPGTLRQAILDANATPDADEVSFRRAGTLILQSDLPDITEDLSISTTLAIAINGNRHQIFEITGPDTDVTIQGLRLVNGLSEFGAAIHLNSAEGEVLVSRTVIAGNRVESTETAGGGGIAIVAGSLTLENSTVSGNVAAGIGDEAIAEGAGILNSGTLTIRNSTLVGNRATGATAYGGALASLGGSVELETVTLTANSAVGGDAKGGAIFDQSVLSVQGSVISKNVALGDEAQGGGLFATGDTTIESFTTAAGRKIVTQILANRALGSAGENGTPGDRGLNGDRGMFPGEDGLEGDSGTDGTDATGGGSAAGGAIWNAGTLDVSDAVISGNIAQGGKGGNGGRGGSGGNGGAGAPGGRDEFGDIVPNGLAGAGGSGGSGGAAGQGGGAEGGAIFNSDSGSITLEKTAVTGNSALAGAVGIPGAGGTSGSGAPAGDAGFAGSRPTEFIEVSGGGIHNAGTLLVTLSSQVVRNVAIGGNVVGGGITNTDSANLTVSDSLISQNSLRAANGVNGRAGPAGASGVRGGLGEDGSDGDAGVDGDAGTDGGSALGGGIYSVGNATIERSTIAGNVLASGVGGNGGNGGRGGNGGLGGAAYYDRDIEEYFPAGARGGGGGGGNGGEAGVGGSAAGGGIFQETTGETSRTLTVSNSTISGNVVRAGAFGIPGRGGARGVGNPEMSGENGTNAEPALPGEGGGGGIFARDGVIRITQSTIALNASARDGGGVVITGEPTGADIRNSTVALNTAAGAGGGLFVAADVDPVAVEVISTIIAKNASKAKEDPDVSGAITASFNLIGLIGNATVTGASNLAGTTTAIDPRLGVLKINGGTTATMLPAATSPALGVGANPDALTTDQRGLPRVAGAATPDMGAVEV